MVQDLRRIILAPEELVDAYEGYRRMTPEFMPGGKIISCVMNADGSVTATLETEGQSETHTLKGGDVLRPLIRFCIENNIMLPRDGKKSISTTDGKATLCVALDLCVDFGEALSPMDLLIAQKRLERSN